MKKKEENHFFSGIVDLRELNSDLEQGNKVAVLGGDYLLSQACGKLAEFRKPPVRLNFYLGRFLTSIVCLRLLKL